MRESTFSIRTTAREEIVLITDQVQDALGKLSGEDGICTIISWT